MPVYNFDCSRYIHKRIENNAWRLPKGLLPKFAYKPILLHQLFEKRKGFIVRFNCQGNKEAWPSILSLHSGVWLNVHEVEEEGWFAEALEGQVSKAGMWSPTICGEVRFSSFRTRSSCTMDPAQGSGHIWPFRSREGGKLWFWVLLEVKFFSSEHALGAWLVVLFCLSLKTAQYLVRNRIVASLGWFCNYSLKEIFTYLCS